MVRPRSSRASERTASRRPCLSRAVPERARTSLNAPRGSRWADEAYPTAVYITAVGWMYVPAAGQVNAPVFGWDEVNYLVKDLLRHTFFHR